MNFFVFFNTCLHSFPFSGACSLLWLLFCLVACLLAWECVSRETGEGEGEGEEAR